jgi:MYXO-CTERM domain-containing protein
MGSVKLLAVVVAAFVLAPAAGAQTELSDVAQQLRSQPVYVDPSTDLVSDEEASSLRRQIDEEADGPLFIAILPESFRGDGSTTDVAMQLGRLVRTAGVYAVVVGDEFRAVSTDLPSGAAGRLATEAFEAHRDAGVAAVLSDFVSRVGEARQDAGESGGEGSSFWPVGLAIGVLALLGFGFVRRRRRARELTEVKKAAREDLVALAEDVTELEAEVDRNPDAKRSYARAIEAYQRADDSFDRARSTQDLSKVSSALAEARFEMENAKAQLEGKPLPEPRPPCFFDPRHGPSARDVWWEPPYGRAVMVPACEADAQRVKAGIEPEAREVEVDGRRRPYWDAPAYYGPWAGGFYGGGLLPGLLVGSALGATMGGPPDAYAEPSGDWSSGDFGGGDFGGGDFGGGGDF